MMNRYTLFALILIAIILLFTVFTVDDDTTEITGYAEDIHQSENGFVFTIIDDDGDEIKAFNREQIDNNLHTFKGSYSSDGRMFFVNGIE